MRKPSLIAWMFVLMVPGIAAAADVEPAPEVAAPAAVGPIRILEATPPPAKPAQAMAGGCRGNPGFAGGRGCGNGGPPYGAGYEARRQWGGFSGPGRGMGRNGGRGAGCGQ